MRRTATVFLVVAMGVSAGFLLGACGDDGSAPPGAGGGATGTMAPTMVGRPGDPADVDRTIEIAALDELAYDPASIEVEVGETIEFSVTNEGATVHEFVIGDDAFQAMHERDMSGGGMGDAMGDGMGHAGMDGAASAGEQAPRGQMPIVSLDPGETGSLVWTFSDPGTVEYACHEPGHYEGGMVGTLQIVQG